MKKQTIKLFAAVVMAMIANTLIGGAVAFVLGFSILIGAVTFIAMGVAFNVIKQVTGSRELKGGLALAGLAREIYLSELIKQVRFDTSFMSRGRDLSAYVVNDTINFAEAGADPGIVEDYDHDEALPIANDEDTPKSISLKSFSTERSRITETQQGTRAYDIMVDRVSRHAATINQNIAKYTANKWAPNSADAFNPIIRTSGDTVNSRKKITLSDVIAFETAMNNLDTEGTRILVLNPTDLGNLKAEDKNLFKSFVPEQMQQGFPLFSFMCYVSTGGPRYTTDGAPTKKAWNAANEDTDLLASFGFIENEVCRAKGSIKLFKNLDDAAYQASFISARTAFIAATMRGKYVGAIVAKSA